MYLYAEKENEKMIQIAINEKTIQGKILLSMLERFKGQPCVTFLDEKNQKEQHQETKDQKQNVIKV